MSNPAPITSLPAIFSADNGTQTFGTALKAELVRLRNRKVWLIAAIMALVSVVGGVAMILITSQMIVTLNEASTETMPTAVLTSSTGASAATGLFMTLLGIYCVSISCRENEDGTIIATLMLVPNRVRLYACRILAWLIVGLVSMAAVHVLAFGISSFIAEPDSIATFARDLGICLVQMAFTVLLCFGLGSLFRKSGLALTAYLFLGVFGSAVIGGIGGMLTGVVGDIVNIVNQLMPSNIVSTIGGTSAAQGDFVLAIAGMIGWIVAMVGGGYIHFRRAPK